MESEELKPCPFCGSSKIKALPPAFGAVRWCIVCDDCHASAGVLHGDSRAATIAAWNRRPAPFPDEARVIGPARLQPYEGGVLAWTGTADSITEPDPAAQAEAAERDEALYSREYHCGSCGGVLGPEYSTCTCDDDPAAELRDNLRELIDMARECGAEKSWIIRGSIDSLVYCEMSGEYDVIPPKERGEVALHDRNEIMFNLGDKRNPAPLLVVLRFAASDGGAAGVEVVE